MPPAEQGDACRPSDKDRTMSDDALSRHFKGPYKEEGAAITQPSDHHMAGIVSGTEPSVR